MATIVTTGTYPVIQLDNPIEIRSAATSNQLEILQAVDDPMAKIVRSLVKISADPYAHNWYTVWEGASYDAIGNWTDQDLAIAIKNIVIEQYPPAK